LSVAVAGCGVAVAVCGSNDVLCDAVLGVLLKPFGVDDDIVGRMTLLTGDVEASNADE